MKQILSHKTLLTIIGLFLFSLIIILPPLIHGYVYPNIGDDTSVYLDRIELMGKGEVSVQYTGYMLIGYPMLFMEKLLHWSIDTQFLWINYLVLIIAGLVLFFVFSKLVNKIAGVISLLTVIFCSQGVMYLFYYGQIFNIINLTIVLPILLLFCVNYITQGKWYNLILTILLSVLFSSFHTNGIYLPALAGIGLVFYLIYCTVKKVEINKRIVIVSGTITVIAIVAFIVLVLLPTATVLKEYVKNPLISSLNNIGKGMTVPLYSWAISILTPFMLGIIVISALYYKNIKEKFNNKHKILFYILLILTVILVIVSFGKISLDPWRQAVDLVIIISMLLSVLMGILLYKHKSIVLIILVVLIISFGSVFHINSWFKYNSAMRDIDFQAIEYMKDYKTFSCSSKVAFWVYERYTDCKHKDNDGEIIIMRSEPMTPRSTEDNIWYQKHGWQPTDEYELVKEFSDNQVEIDIYVVKEYFRFERLQNLLSDMQEFGLLNGSPELLGKSGWVCPNCGKRYMGYADNTCIFTDNPPMLFYQCNVCDYKYKFKPIETGNWYDAVMMEVK
jgi:DNA-directed RNA polymerase subunit M/transcription elongation factor TFIIS